MLAGIFCIGRDVVKALSCFHKNVDGVLREFDRDVPRLRVGMLLKCRTSLDCDVNVYK